MSEHEGARAVAKYEDVYVLEIEWMVPNLPRLVGPFDTRTEAEDWGRLNIANGAWNVAPLCTPYARPRGQRAS